MKKVTAILLALAMTVSTAACGGGQGANQKEGGSDAPAETSKDTSADTTEQARENQEADAGESAETDLSDAPTLTIFVDETWWPYDKWEGAVPEEFSKRLGVNIEVIRAADDNQLALMVASGDMTDIVCSYRYQYMADSQVSYPLDELHETYPDVDFEVDPVLQFVNQAPDGHYYTIGCGFSPAYDYEKYDKILTEGPGFMYRADIAQELGITFNTLEDLDAAFEKVAQAYPDYTVCSFNSAHKFSWLLQQMGLKNGGYYEAEDGTLKWWLRQDGLLDYYKKVNEWYRKGYVTAENFAYQSEDDTKEICVGGTVFANFGYDNHADNYNTAIGVNGDDFTFSLVTNELGDNNVLQPRGLKYWGWLVHNAIVTSIAEANSDSQTAEDRKNLTLHVNRNPVMGMIRFETDSDESNINTKLDEMVKNQNTNIFMAESEEACEAAFNEMIAQAEQIGMSTLEDYANQTYPDLKARYDEILAGAQ